MIFLNIILGLIGLGIVIFAHELGHFIAAKSCGIAVEAFSIGWGKVLYSFRYKGTEYRLSLFPIGGYCKMKGEETLRRAVDRDEDRYDEDKGSLFSVAPWKRVVTYFAGPAANILFAILVLSVIWFAGYSVSTYENRIVLLSESPLAENERYPADEAGLKTGDRIVEIDGREVASFRDIESNVTPSGGKTLSMVVLREGRRIATTITPELDRTNGSGRIGVAAWVEPIISKVADGSPAMHAGLREGDRIVRANGMSMETSLSLYEALEGGPEVLVLEVERAGVTSTLEMNILYDDQGGANLGFSFEHVNVMRVERNPIKAIAKGAKETFETFKLAVTSIGLLFRGVNIRNTVSGPIRITYIVGEVASSGFAQGPRQGLIVVFRFLSILSIALCFMNLLPIPALDGGSILLTIIEMVIRRPVRPRIFYRYQIVGFMILLAILVLTTFNDIFFLARQ